MTKDRKALLVGIDDYGGKHNLPGCRSDVIALSDVLTYNDDIEKSFNFHCKTVLPSLKERIDRVRLRDELVQLFSHVENKDVLFYFAGHGATSPFGAELVTQGFEKPNSYGVSMNDVVFLANHCKAKHVTIILDCCHSGDIGSFPGFQSELGLSLIGQGVHILAASRGAAVEENGHGLYTERILVGLKGASRNLLGDVSVAVLHSYASGAFGAHDQAPVYKSSAKDDFVIRKCQPRLSLSELRLLTRYFASPSSLYPLDKGHDDGGQRQANPTGKVAIYYLLQKFRDNGLLEIQPDLWHMLREEKPVGLSPLGQYYWNVVKAGGI